jgi:hypothetical protein
MANLLLTNPAQQSDVIAALLQSELAIPLTAPVVVITPLVPASTTYSYTVVTKVNGEVTPGSATSTTGAASLSGSTPNSVSWGAPPYSNGGPQPTYDVYRTTGGTTQGKIASNLTTTSLVDSGLAGDGTSVPPFNTSGTAGFGVFEPCLAAAASGAITIGTGNVAITLGSAAALTLPLPIAGPASAGGQDGASLTIFATTAFAHTVTTPANGINGSLHVATFAAAVGNAVMLTAYNGKWYTASINGVTIS